MSFMHFGSIKLHSDIALATAVSFQPVPIVFSVAPSFVNLHLNLLQSLIMCIWKLSSLGIFVFPDMRFFFLQQNQAVTISEPSIMFIVMSPLTAVLCLFL